MQADGHINLHGTGITPGQTDEYRAGSRNKMERSKIRMKAGHVEIEAIGDETRPKQYGVAIQSNQAPISVKTLLEGDPGNIHVAAAENVDITAWNNFYRSTRMGHIEDTAKGSYFASSQSGDMNISASAGEARLTGYQNVGLYACGGDLLGDAAGNIMLNHGSNPPKAEVGKWAYIPETMELLSIDLPNPRAAVGTSVTQLALNKNDVELGVGGENIRNLHDTIENLQLGLSAYVTKKLPATNEAKIFETDQSSMARTGGYTYELEAPWSGYDDHNVTILPLGPEKAKPDDDPVKPC